MIRHECGYFSTELFDEYSVYSKREWRRNSLVNCLFSPFFMRESRLTSFPPCVTGFIYGRLNACTGFFVSCHDSGEIGSISGSLILLPFCGMDWDSVHWSFTYRPSRFSRTRTLCLVACCGVDEISHPDFLI